MRRKAETRSDIHLKTTPEQRKRLKIVCAEEELSYIDLIMKLLDDREARFTRARRLQGSPLHRSGEAVSEL